MLSLLVYVLSGACGLATAAPTDLTQTTPAKTKNSYNLGPTGALGWMYVEGGMTVKARQILIAAVEKALE